MPILSSRTRASKSPAAINGDASEGLDFGAGTNWATGYSRGVV
jgi:hypothetical protein